MKIFPAIDLSAGAVVRLRQGRFEDETVYERAAEDVARGYAEAGARRMHVVDLDGARDPRARQVERIRSVLAAGPPAQVGGGVRCAADAEALFDAGAAAVIVGSLALREPATLRRMLESFGGERVVLAVDCRHDAGGVPRVLTQGWTVEESATVGEVVSAFREAGLGRLLCTDVARDGMLAGPNVELYGSLVAAFPGLEVLASGGVRDAADLERLAAAGAHGAIVGRALYEGTLALADALRFEEAPC